MDKPAISNIIFAQLQQLQEYKKLDRKFLLKKDLPGCPAGTTFVQIDPYTVIPNNMKLVPGHLNFNILLVEDEYNDFFEPIKLNHG